MKTSASEVRSFDNTELAEKMLATYWPSLALWRGIELKQLLPLEFSAPIIDIGCGDGTFSQFLFEQVDVGVDVSATLLARARERGLYGELRQCYAHGMPYGDQEFQTVFSNSVLEHIPNLRDTIRELSRVLVPGGKLVITVPTERLESYMLCKHSWYLRFRNSVLTHVHLLSLEEWEALLMDAGLRIVHEHSYMQRKTVRYWDSLDLMVTPHLGPLSPVVIWRGLPKVWLRRVFRNPFLHHYSLPNPAIVGGSRLIIAQKQL